MKALVEKKRNAKFDTLNPSALDHVPAIHHGRIWEPVAIEKARGILDPEHDAIWYKPAIVPDPYDPVCCSPDATFYKNKRFYGLEVKNPFSRPLPTSADRVDIQHVVQCFVCLHVTRADCWFLFYYSYKDDRYMIYRVNPDIELWRSEFVPRIEKFLKFVDSGLPIERLSKEERVETENLKKRVRSTVTSQRLPPSR